MISIVGYGYVGQATHKLLGDVDYILDVNTPRNVWDEASKSDYVFVCVPTPSNSDGSCDLHNITETLQKLGPKPLYVIRSTIPWTFKAPAGYRVVASPEFLNQNDFLDDQTYKPLLGGLYEYTKLVELLYRTECVHTTWDIAWQVKYTSNLYGAFKVAFWEMIQDITGNERCVYNTLKKLNINQGDMAQISMDGFRGFGGACFPKDTKAIASMTNHPLLRSVIQYNESIK